MKILIPLSGGLDSSVLAYETLRDTTHEVMLVHFAEDYNPSLKAAKDSAGAAASAIAAWLSAKVRTATYQVVANRYADNDGNAFDTDDTLPVVPGFTATFPTYRHLCRYASYGYAASLLSPDEVWKGSTTTDSKRRWGEDTRREDAYGSYTTAVLKAPMREAGRGRFENMGRLPKGLEPLVQWCDAGQETGCGLCFGCQTREFFTAYCYDMDFDKLAAVDLKFLEAAGIGVGVTEVQDPATYIPLNRINRALIHPKWPQWITDIWQGGG